MLPLPLIGFYLICADVILLAEGLSSSAVIVILAIVAAIFLTLAYVPAGGWRR